MTPALLITLRETLEASLVVGIVLAFLHRSKQARLDGIVWFAVAAGVIVSLILAWLFATFFGGFEGRAEQLYEGITMLTAAGLITWMVLWMSMQGRGMRQNIESRVETHLERDHSFGIFFLVFFSVIREGIETVIFLQAAYLQSQSASHHLGAFLGIVIAIGTSWLLFKGMMSFPLQRFFTASSVLLALFAAGLFAHGIHEMQEAGVIPLVVAHVWDTNAFINDNGTLGGILRGVFGYNANPSLPEAVGYFLYLAALMFAWHRMQRVKR